MPITQVEDLADTRIAQKISQIAGVGLVSINGAQRPAVRVQANLSALAAYGLNIDDLRTTVANANSNAPKGSFDGTAQSYSIDANDQISSADQYASIIVAYKNNDPVRLSDVATVTQSAENNKLASWMNTTPAILLNVQRQPGANVIAVVNQIRQVLPDIRSSMPANVDVTVLSDRTNTIRASVNDVEFELSLAVALVVLVIFLFLRNIPATIIPSLSVPLSLIGTFAVMYLCGFSLNNLSLMALTIASGFVVDDAIVMIENISRYIEKGEKPLAAALKGSGEIGFTIVSLTVSLIAVLIPLLFMREVVAPVPRIRNHAGDNDPDLGGRVADAGADAVRQDAAPHAETSARRQSRSSAASSENIQRLIAGYDRLLTWVLDHQPLTCGGGGHHGTDGHAYIVIPKGFFPLQDTGFIQAITGRRRRYRLPPWSSASSAGREILQDHDVASLSSFIGVDGTNNTLNSGRFLINLKPKAEPRQHQAPWRGWRRGARVRGITLYLQPVQDLTIDSPSVARRTSSCSRPRPPGAARGCPSCSASSLRAGARQCLDQLLDSGLSAQIEVDRDTAARFGVTAATIDNALYDAFGQRIISTIYTQSNEYRVILEAIRNCRTRSNR